MGFPVPAVEAAHDRNLLRVRSPNGEIGPRDVPQRYGMAPELFIEMEMASLIEQIEIIFGEQGKLIA
jgi:hypothetical protein